MQIKSLNDLIEKTKIMSPKRKVAVAVAEDDVVLKSINQAIDLGICEAILFGDYDKIKNICENENIDINKFEVRNFENKKEAIISAIKSVSSGETDLPMKGKCTTGELLSIYLKEEYELRGNGSMSLVSVFEIDSYHKPLIMSDGGMLIAPTIEQKVDIINNTVFVANKMGVENPKVAVIAALEKVNPKMSATLDAAVLTQMNRRNQIQNCIVDGPFAIDNAISKHAAEQKGIISEVAGDSDVIIMPDIEAGNVFYKSMVFLAKSKIASSIVGGKKPVVLTSRADSNEAKLFSIALSVLMS